MSDLSGFTCRYFGTAALRSVSLIKEGTAGEVKLLFNVLFAADMTAASLIGSSYFHYTDEGLSTKSSVCSLSGSAVTGVT